MTRLSLFLLLAISIWSCTRGPGDTYIDLENRVWHFDSTAHFTFEVDTGNYDIFFYLRNTNEYGWSNIYFTHILEDTLGNQLDSTLSNHELFDLKTGRPFGKGQGDIFEHTIPLYTNYRFPGSGKYQLRVRHTMRADSLREILSVGAGIRKTEIR